MFLRSRSGFGSRRIDSRCFTRAFSSPIAHDPVKCRRENEGNDAHELDEDVDRRTGCILERITDRITDDSSFVGIATFAAIVSAFDVFLRVIPSTTRVRHKDGENDTGDHDADEHTAEYGTIGMEEDVEDTGDAYVINAYLAGVNRDEIDVELNEGRLSISVNKTESEEEQDKNYLHKETRAWSASRGVYLKDAATEGLSAKLDGGVLTINVPKQDEKANITKVSID